MFEVRNKWAVGSRLAAVLGPASGLTAQTTKLQAAVIASTMRLPKEPRHLRGKHYPHSSTRQRERGARQIASGMCKPANGLVRPGQVIVTDGGKMFIRRPY